MQEYHISANEAGQRFDKYLKKRLCHAQSSFIYKMLRKKNIVLNDKKADGTEKLSLNDSVKFYFSEETFAKFTAGEAQEEEFSQLSKLDIHQVQIIYETEDILAINKPAGILSQKATPNDISANELILAYLIQKQGLTAQEMETFRPSICNRLDRNTSGILLAGKTLAGLQHMSEDIKTRNIQKFYRCLVKGEVHQPAYLKGYLHKNERTNQVTVTSSQNQWKDALPIETEYRPIRTAHGYTELEVHLITGRSHQIRAHLASIGHPIIGDGKYGEKKKNTFFYEKYHLKYQLLHAYRLKLEDGTIITAPFPKEFAKILSDIFEKKDFK